ncbi:MAG: c-type cytochrome [Anaerolineae bacterium]|nr:c-type cytochrome [Anaerolineae bacterium]
MIGNIITLVILVALVVLFAWLVTRAWRSKRWYIKWPGILVAGLLTLLFALVTLVLVKGLYDFSRSYPVARVNVAIAGTPEQIARGEHMATVLCATCHSQNGQLPLSGGNNLSADAGLPLGDLYAPNITPAGKIKELSDNDLYRILRTGVEPNGHLTFMGGVTARFMSDDDAQAVVAYLRQSTPVENQTPPISFSPLLTLFAGAGLISFNVPDVLQPINSPPKAANKEYGEYVVRFMDCRGCHGPTLSGDAPPPSPPGASNLTVVVPNWSKDDFFQAMRTGVDSTGHKISPPMPWKQIGLLDDVELDALYEYLHALTPITAQK